MTCDLAEDKPAPVEDDKEADKSDEKKEDEAKDEEEKKEDDETGQFKSIFNMKYLSEFSRHET